MPHPARPSSLLTVLAILAGCSSTKSLEPRTLPYHVAIVPMEAPLVGAVQKVQHLVVRHQHPDGAALEHLVEIPRKLGPLEQRLLDPLGCRLGGFRRQGGDKQHYPDQTNN